MLKMAFANIYPEDGPCCPICLKQFNKPRQLPCAHSFCEKCLQSHITKTTKHQELRNVQCPVCRNSASPFVKHKPKSEWASLFPPNTVLQSVLPTKSKVDRLCDTCDSDGVSVLAEGFCVVCKEAMCGDCIKYHRKQKMLKNHTILGLDEIVCNPDNAMKLAEGFTCYEHEGEDIKYYCKDHKVPCCGACFFRGHKMCSKVIYLKEELPALLRESKPDEIIADMKKIEMHLKTFVKMNESSVNNLETQVNGLIDEIRNVRKKINSALDEFEKRVKTEGSKIYSEEVIRKQEENHQCLSLIHAVRNSQYLLWAVNKYGSNLQKFLMAEKVRSHLHYYYSLVGDKYVKIDRLTVEVEFTSSMQSILSFPLSTVGKVVTMTSCKTLPTTFLQKTMKDCQVEIVDVVNLKVPAGNTVPLNSQPRYTGITCIPGERVMLAARESLKYILLSSSYQFITSHTLRDFPHSICAMDDKEVAVSFGQNNIQFLSVRNDLIWPVRNITTRYSCYGIAAAGERMMVVNGKCGKYGCYWALISTTTGAAKYSYEYDSPHHQDNCIALNNIKTRVYVTVVDRNSLLCFEMDGKKQFTYSPGNLSGPNGVAVDRYDNIYILGHWSHNIHQLSPDGSVLQVISSGVPKNPVAICIHKSKDRLIITDTSHETKLHIYQLK